MQKPAPDQRRAFIHITGPSTLPADPMLRPLPGRGVQGERGEGSGEERVSQSLTSRSASARRGREGLRRAPCRNPGAKDMGWHGHLPPEQSLEGSHEVGGGGEGTPGRRIWIFTSCPFGSP